MGHATYLRDGREYAQALIIQQSAVEFARQHRDVIGDGSLKVALGFYGWHLAFASRTEEAERVMRERSELLSPSERLSDSRQKQDAAMCQHNRRQDNPLLREARQLQTNAHTCYRRGDADQAADLADASIAIWTELATSSAIKVAEAAVSIRDNAAILSNTGRKETALQYMDASLSLFRQWDQARQSSHPNSPDLDIEYKYGGSVRHELFDDRRRRDADGRGVRSRHWKLGTISKAAAA